MTTNHHRKFRLTYVPQRHNKDV